MLTTRLLIIIVVVLIILAIVSMVIGARQHMSASGSSAEPTDSSWKPAWMMSWMSWVNAPGHFPLSRISVDKVVLSKGAIEIPPKGTVVLMVSADTAASNPQQLTLALADQKDAVASTAELVSIDCLVTGGSPPAQIASDAKTSFPVPKSTDKSSPSADKSGHAGTATSTGQSSSNQPNPWQVAVAIYPSRGGQITLTSHVNQRLTVNVQ